jgi:UDP-N-acetylglucosamine 4,6-dehydratase
VIVTGGTGSIGREIVKQLLESSPKVVRVFSRDETKHYELFEELGDRPDVRYLVGDIRDRLRLKRAMEGVDVVFHAAALKHVPSCEYNPFEAVQTNVVGTQNVIEAALDAGVKRLIAISTDKAVNPTNTMGATKLLAEKIVSSAYEWTWAKGLRLSSVRFGNVLGSRGSVVPIIRRQVEKGGPATLIGLNMTRFVMTIPDAVGLVLKAAMLTERGEVFILKMPVLRVTDLLDVLIEEYAPVFGRKPSEIEIKPITARAGERAKEELLTVEEAERQTFDIGGMWKVYPQHFIAKHGLKPKPVVPSQYDSEEAKPMSHAEIRAMLKKAALI